MRLEKATLTSGPHRRRLLGRLGRRLGRAQALGLGGGGVGAGRAIAREGAGRRAGRCLAGWAAGMGKRRLGHAGGGKMRGGLARGFEEASPFLYFLFF
jgi:hypothetical protein